MKGWKSALRIIIESTLMACLLGIALDMVTAHIAVEYFTYYHVKVVDSESPVVMALVWGVYAAYWFGIIAGILLVIANEARKQPLAVSRIRRILCRGCIGIWSTLMLILGGTYLSYERLHPGPYNNFEAERRLASVTTTHSTEYILGAIVTLIACYLVWSHPTPINSAATETD